MYGPTKTTIWSSCCKLNEYNDIHIGDSIKNTIFLNIMKTMLMNFC